MPEIISGELYSDLESENISTETKTVVKMMSEEKKTFKKENLKQSSEVRERVVGNRILKY